MNYFYQEKNKNKKIIVIIIIVAILLITLKPLSFIKKILEDKFLLYRSTHDSVDINIKYQETYRPIQGTIIENSYNTLKIKSSFTHATVHPIQIGIICEKGNNPMLGNYVKIRHVTQDSKIYYSVYGNLPSLPNFSSIDWLSPTSILYDGYSLDFLYFQVLDQDGNIISPYEYIKLS